MKTQSNKHTKNGITRQYKSINRIIWVGLTTGIMVFVLLTVTTIVKGTIYDLFSGANSLLDGPDDKRLHFKVNDQNMDMIIGSREDNGDLLSTARNNKSLPFYRDKNGGLSIHVNGGINKESISSPANLMAMIEPLMAFANGSSTKYVSLKLDKGFDITSFLDVSTHDSKELFVYPSSERINTIQTSNFSIGHYRAQTTVGVVMNYYDSMLKSHGYKKLRQASDIALYRSTTQMIIVNVEARGNYVSIIVYSVKNK